MKPDMEKTVKVRFNHSKASLATLLAFASIFVSAAVAVEPVGSVFRNDHMSRKDDWKFQLHHDKAHWGRCGKLWTCAAEPAVRLTWTPVERATGYKVRIGTQKGEYRSTFDAGVLTAYK